MIKTKEVNRQRRNQYKKEGNNKIKKNNIKQLAYIYKDLTKAKAFSFKCIHHIKGKTEQAIAI